MTTYPLVIITPQGKIFEADVFSFIGPGTDGQFGVLAGHAPMVKLLGEGVVQIKGEGKTTYFVIDSGVLEVNELGEVLVLADTAVASNSFDDAKAKVLTLA